MGKITKVLWLMIKPLGLKVTRGHVSFFSIGFNKSHAGNIYNSADMAIHIFDDKQIRNRGISTGFGLIRGEVKPFKFKLWKQCLHV